MDRLRYGAVTDFLDFTLRATTGRPSIRRTAALCSGCRCWAGTTDAPPGPARLEVKAGEAARLLRLLANEKRLLILCW